MNFKTTKIFFFIFLIFIVRSNAFNGEIDLNSFEECERKPPAQSGSRKATTIAQSSAHDAKMAKDSQAMAGQQASHQVKQNLAEKAEQAAKAAEAAVAGKKSIFEHFTKKVKEAQDVVDDQICLMHKAQTHACTAMKASQQAMSLFKILCEAVQAAERNVESAEKTAKGTEMWFEEKRSIVKESEERYQKLMEQLRNAKKEMAKIEKCAKNATSAASEAEQNIQRDKRVQKKLYSRT